MLLCTAKHTMNRWIQIESHQLGSQVRELSTYFVGELAVQQVYHIQSEEQFLGLQLGQGYREKPKFAALGPLPTDIELSVS